MSLENTPYTLLWQASLIRTPIEHWDSILKGHTTVHFRVVSLIQDAPQMYHTNQ